MAVSYYSNKKGLKAELGSERLLEVPLETYILSEKLAIESENADENIEIMKAYMCKQRGIRLIKLPMKGTELDYANNLKKAFRGNLKEYQKAGMPKRVLVIDDIYTTGSTAEAVTTALKQLGVQEVYVFCIAIGKGFS